MDVLKNISENWQAYLVALIICAAILFLARRIWIARKRKCGDLACSCDFSRRDKN